ncbi:hypothetical protein HYPSUDRAFT_683448 [Hypholoma sublateritium FD-334 SS-4]|uniref:Uncharacterized protein n=1 Tax=Hypholoma sublateritium (strain FD-334 SS-4) TaxID=945553 RepID=A0A0D2ME31_HYPSF|nr:hypothetical protein HYPSUDRAFT_683448 [Hypholoma sublateritium FD-334 SS-4]
MDASTASLGTPTGGPTPSIRVFPASPSPRPSTLGGASGSLSPLSMSAIGDDFGALAPLMYGPRLTVPHNEDITRTREAVFAQIRRRRSGGLRTGALPTPPLPPRPPARSLSDESITTVGELYDNELPAPRAPSPASSSAPSSAPSDDDDEGGTTTPYYSPLSNSAGLPASPPDVPRTDPRPPSAAASLEDPSGTEAATPALQILRTPAALRHARSVSRLVERLPIHLVQLLGRTLGDPPVLDGGAGTGVLEFFERVFPYRGERTASAPPGSSAVQSSGTAATGDLGPGVEMMPPVLGPGTLDDTSAGYQESVSAGHAQ